MKNYLLTLLLLLSLLIKCTRPNCMESSWCCCLNSGADLAQTMDDFYGSIEIPEGASVSLVQVYHSKTVMNQHIT